MAKLKIRLHKNGKFENVEAIAETAVLAAQNADNTNPDTDFLGIVGREEVDEPEGSQFAEELF